VAWTTIAAIYFITWWVVLFAILPWGVKSQTEHDEEIPPGTDPGAPILPRLGMKIIWTTIVATVLFVSVSYVFVNRWVTIEDMASWVGMPK
jgi:predicted secreted protein